MTLFSTILLVYLSIGILFAILANIAFNYIEKECSEHSKMRKEYDDSMAKVGTVFKNPKLFAVLSLIIFWPNLILKLVNK